MGLDRRSLSAGMGWNLTYSMSIEDFESTYLELEPLYRKHYAEMCERREKEGEICPPFNPRLDEYFRASRGKYLITFVLRYNELACGYINMYITNDMHNHEPIAQEDSMFVLKEHRNGMGRKLVLFGMEELKRRGVKKIIVSAMVDLRVSKLWARMGFKNLAQQMIYQFQDGNNVQLTPRSAPRT